MSNTICVGQRNMQILNCSVVIWAHLDCKQITTSSHLRIWVKVPRKTTQSPQCDWLSFPSLLGVYAACRLPQLTNVPAFGGGGGGWIVTLCSLSDAGAADNEPSGRMATGKQHNRAAGSPGTLLELLLSSEAEAACNLSNTQNTHTFTEKQLQWCIIICKYYSSSCTVTLQKTLSGLHEI